MKTTKFLIIALLFMGFGVAANAQAVSASATATTTIITPLAITKAVDMSFGNIAVGVSSGTVVLTPAGTRTPSGGVNLPSANIGTVTAASFDVTGAANYTYSITLPSSNVTLLHTNGTNNMIANSFTSTPSSTGTLNESGSQTLKVGATLNVTGSQLAGVYTSSGFNVTVNYN